MNWYKIVIAGSRDDFLRSLGATEDIVSFISSQQEQVANVMTNEFRKNPQLTSQQLQQMIAPQKKQPDFSKEIQALNMKFDDEMVKWILPMIRIRRKTMTYEESAPEYKEWFSNMMGAYSELGRKLSEIKDWKNANDNVQISSHTLEQAIAASDQWHKMMAEKGQNLIYEEKNIVYGPNWDNEEFNGWTVQEVRSENDLKVEGNRMHHCVAGFCDAVESGEKKIFSLRDPGNEPHVTMEVSPDMKEAAQIQGKSNSEPKPLYKSMIKEWFSKPGTPEYFVDDNIDDRWNYAFSGYGYGAPSIDEATKEAGIILDQYKEGDDYGLKPSGHPADYLSTMYEGFLKSIYKSNDRGYYRSSDSPELLAEVAVDGGEKTIEELLGLMEITENGKYDAKNKKWIERGVQEDFDMWMMDSGIEYPQEENYETTEEFQEAEKQYYEAEADMRRESVPLGWIDDINKALHREIERKLGMTMQQWYDRKKEKVTAKTIYFDLKKFANNAQTLANTIFQMLLNAEQSLLNPPSIGNMYDTITIKEAIALAREMLVRKSGTIFLTPAQEQLLQILDTDSVAQNKNMVPENGEMNVQENIENVSPSNPPDIATIQEP